MRSGLSEDLVEEGVDPALGGGGAARFFDALGGVEERGLMEREFISVAY